MMRKSDENPKSGQRLSLQPLRSYALPGGPLAVDLGKVDVKVLAEFRRGSASDRGTGSRR